MWKVKVKETRRSCDIFISSVERNGDDNNKCDDDVVDKKKK